VSWRDGSIEERLQYALVKGVGDCLETDLDEAVQKYGNPVRIIEGPLMSAMNTVGELFGAGKMFLPQVVKTARTMKKAVGILQPLIEASRSEGAQKAGKVLMATVKGDVHDIGKNIVSVILSCNNYEVIDLGVMVPTEEIVERAVAEKADIIGLSGLITPSLEEMVNVARALESRGLNIPIMIGGATTSELHTALKIAPVYSGPVLWMKDAAQNVIAAARILNPDTSSEYVAELDDKYAHLRAEKESESADLVSLEEARNRKPKLF
jgi:5-methyltetrahydrofolate--homocysteine methyltransferase